MIKAYKKLLSILITMAVLSGICLTNMGVAAADEAEALIKAATETVSEETISPKIKKMMTVLKKFNIIPDYYDYNVPLENEVSRADFAASVAKMMGKTEYRGSEVYFYDVPKNYWAYNEISNLTDMGILSGSGDKIFNPSEPITKGAAYKMLLCAMGYREYAEMAGGFPKGYVKVAGDIKLSKGVSGSEIVTMSDMLTILYNALTVNIMEIGSFSGDSIKFNSSDDETLISSYRNIYYGKGDVNGANSITINGEPLKSGYALIGDELYECEGFDMMEYIGEKVEFFYESEDLSDDKKLVWVGHSDSAQEIKIISAEGDAYLDIDTFVYTYYENDKQRRITLDRSTVLIYNGEIIASGYDTILNGKTYELKLITNNGKNTMIVRAYKNYVVGTINSQDYIIYDKNNPASFVNLDKEDYDSFSIKLMGKDEIAFEDIKKGAILSVYQSDKHIEVYVSYNSISGTIEEIRTENVKKIVIDGNEYRVDDSVPSDSYSVGDQVTAYVNAFGEIVYITTKAGIFQGAFLISAKFDRREDCVYIRLLGEDGKVTKLKCVEKNFIFDGKKCKSPVETYTELLAGGSNLTAQFALIRKNADGEIKEIDTAKYHSDRENTNSLQVDVPFCKKGETTYEKRTIRANSNAARIGEKIVFDADTKVFVVPDETDYASLDDAEFWSTVGSKLANDTGTYAESYRTAKKIGITKYLLLKGYDPSRVNGELPILVQKIVSGVDDYGSVVEILEGYQGASTVSVKAYDGVSNLFSQKGIQTGDVVTLKRDSYGNVKDCDIKYACASGIHNALTTLNDNAGMFVGYAHDVIDDVVKIGYASGADYDYAINAMSKPVLVYDTTKTKNAISVGTTGDIITYANSPANCSTVLIVTNKMQPLMFVVYK